MTDYTSLKVPELKKLLQEKSLSATGNKADLIARLKEHDDAQGGVKPAGTSAVALSSQENACPIQLHP